MARLFIEAFGFGGFRSFADPQYFGPLSTVNLFAGQNNSGKSNVLLFLHKHFGRLAAQIKGGTPPTQLEPLDQPAGTGAPPLVVAFGVPHSGERYQRMFDHPNFRDSSASNSYLKQFLTCETMTAGTPVTWFRYVADRNTASLRIADLDAIRGKRCIGLSELSVIWHNLTNHTGGSPELHLEEIFQRLSPAHQAMPEVAVIPAFRQIKSDNTGAFDYGGLGLIERLAQLQDPKFVEADLAERQFQTINTFVKTIVGDENARLQIPWDRSSILVHLGGKRLPLESLGTGIHQVVILAAMATVLTEQVVCIEEPELHLHPVLQRKLLKYLADQTSNQYFITTHSAHILDAPGAAVFHVRLEGGRSVVGGAFSAREKAAIATDLGYRASDLLQTNCVIWVEGPSDRVYLVWWIQHKDRDLVEGLHYTIMFYGGRLLSHLTAEDPDVNEFISLRRLNRKIAIVIDSDKRTKGGRINETKRRVRNEFNSGPGFAWVTAGREIENYIQPTELGAAARSCHPSVMAHATPATEFDDALAFTSRKTGTLTPDKVRIAKEVANGAPDFSVLDLNKQVSRLVEFIKSANKDD